MKTETYKAGMDLEKGDMVFIKNGKLYKFEKQKEPTQIFNMFFDEFTFGKFGKQQKTLLEVIQSDKAYIIWCVENNVIGVSEKIEDRFNSMINN